VEFVLAAFAAADDVGAELGVLAFALGALDADGLLVLFGFALLGPRLLGHLPSVVHESSDAVQEVGRGRAPEGGAALLLGQLRRLVVALLSLAPALAPLCLD